MFVAIVFFMVSNVSAEELILEFDVDEFISNDQEDSIVKESISLEPAKLTDPVFDKKNEFLQGYQQLFQMNQEEISGLQAVLYPLKEELSNIDTQIEVISQQINRVRDLQSQLSVKQLQLHDLASRLRVQQQLLELEIKDVVKKFERSLQLYYQIKRQYVDEKGSLQWIQLLATADDPADILFQDFLLERVQLQMIDQIGSLSQQQLQLDQLGSSLKLIGSQYDQYEDQLGSSAAVMVEQQLYEEELKQQKTKEQHFFALQLEQAREEQQALSIRIQEIARGVEIDQYSEFPVQDMIWPVSPVLGISSQFQDAGYAARFGLEHNAIDIPTDQLTSIKAPLNGEVLKVHDGGLGYSYLQLGHRDGLSTVYGHVYSFKVQEGDFVQQGQIIALSGGGIGTKGAGKLTTGPHLHFEVLKDGTPIDPLKQLPELSF